MKTFLTAAILGVTGLAGVAGAEAQDVHKYRGGTATRHERRDDHRDFRRNRHRETVARGAVLGPPRYRDPHLGYDHCGRPITSQVCVAAGYWSTRPLQLIARRPPPRKPGASPDAPGFFFSRAVPRH